MIFPQLLSASIAQRGAERQRLYRTVRHDGLNGRAWSDPANPLTRWYLPYRELSRVEAQTLEEFYHATYGSLQSFTFCDPFDNLLVWSEEFNRPVWQRSPYLIHVGPVADPMGGSRGVRFRNGSSGAQSLWQRVGVPSSYFTTFTVWLRADVPQAIDLVRRCGAQSISNVVEAGPVWRRFSLSSSGLGESLHGEWSVVVGANQEVELFGAQLDAQRAASRYMKSEGKGGLYREARFTDMPLTITAVDHNSYRCDIMIEARK